MSNNGYSIISKLNYSNFTSAGTLPSTYFNDNNVYGTLTWLPVSSPTLAFNATNQKYVNIPSTSARLQTPQLFSTFNAQDTDWQVETDIEIATLNADNAYFGLHSLNSNTRQISLIIKSTFNKGLTILLQNGTMEVSCNYKFETNKRYNIVVSKSGDTYSFIINGTIVGNSIATKFLSAFSIINMNFIYGSCDVSSNAYNLSNGKLYGLNLCLGSSFKYDTSFTKYGNNLVSQLNFGNLATATTSTSFTCDLESVINSPVSWIYNSALVTTTGEFYTNKTSFKTSVSNNFTTTFNIKNSLVNPEVNLVNINDKYKVLYSLTKIGVPEPDVIVNDKTKSALNFENGLTDQIPSTVWSTTGTPQVQSSRKIYGNYSLESTANGDSLYTSASLLTGGVTPFTIDFYLLVNNQSLSNILPVLSKSSNSLGVSQGLYIKNSSNLQVYRSSSIGSVIDVLGNIKLRPNEINKITYSFDGAAVRTFINNKLDVVYGVGSGFTANTDLDYKFLNNYIPSIGINPPTTSTLGVIDNINVFDGEARVVREPDSFASNLIVDMAFDGANNSGTIVDNGTLKSTWAVQGTASITTDQKFDGYSSLYINTAASYITSTINTVLSKNFTISFKYRSVNSVASAIFDGRSAVGNYDGLLITTPSADTNSITVYMNGNSSTSSWDVSLNSGTFISLNTDYKIDIVCNNNLLSIYVNGALKASNQFNFDVTASLNNLVALGRNVSGGGGSRSGYFKNFKIYKDVAVVPLDTSTTIKLDFNNNLLDSYNNSTWTNSSTTFDQINSYEGYALYFNGSTRIYTGASTIFNLAGSDFNLEFNAMPATLDGSARILFSNGETSVDPNLKSITYHPNGLLYSYLGNSSTIGNFGLTTISNAIGNTYVKHNVCRRKNVFYMKINDVLNAFGNAPNGYLYNLNSSNKTNIGTADYTSSAPYKGYLDSLSVAKGINNIDIDQPAVHLPLESMVWSTGVSNINDLVNMTGSTAFTTVSGKKCIDIRSGSFFYNSNTVFKITDNSDFYIELDYYPTTNNYHVIFSSRSGSADSNLFTITMGSSAHSVPYGIYIWKSTGVLQSTNSAILNAWNNIIVKRNNNVLSLIVNGVETTFNYSGPLDYSYDGTSFGRPVYDLSGASNAIGYLSNFKFFLGRSTIPETWDPTKVLDLDFKPTGQSYVFGDNYKKVVFQPTNFNTRDYYKNRYCVYFDGSTNKYIQTTRNNLLNFGYDNWVGRVDFLVSQADLDYDKWKLILGTGTTDLSNNYCYLGISPPTTSGRPNSLTFTVSNNNITTTLVVPTNIIINEWQTVYFGRVNGVYTMMYNGVSSIVQSSSGDPNFNLNGMNNTIIGRSQYSIDHQFRGYLSKIRILRSVSDFSLLDVEPNAATIHEKFKLTNGTDGEEMLFINDTSEKTVKLINDTDTISLSVNNNIVEVPKDNTVIDSLELMNGYVGDIKNIKLYNTAFYDDDSFSGTQLIDTQFGEITIHENNLAFETFEGDYRLKGFIEGYTDRKFLIYDTERGVVLYTGVEDYDYNNFNSMYMENYQIHDLVSGQKYPINNFNMIKGYISGTVSLKRCGVKSSNMKVYCYRSDTNRFIGIYSVDKDGNYNIPNLDINSRYDIIFRDTTRTIKDQISNYRKPISY